MTFRFSAVTHGFIAFVFSIGAAIILTCIGSSQSFAITFSAQGGNNAAVTCSPGDGSGYNLTGSAPVAGSAVCAFTSPAGTFDSSGSIASGANAGHVGASANSTTTGSAAGVTLSATATYSDTFIFTSSNPGTTTDVTLNLNVGGTLAVGGPFAVASVNLNASINGINGAQVFSLQSGLTSVFTDPPSPPISSCSSSFAGNAGCSGLFFAGGNLLSNLVTVPLGAPVLVQLFLEVNAFAAAPGSSSSVEFGESLDFPIGSALFNLANGVTVNAPDSFVANNIFAPPTSATPLPAALPLFAGGLGVIGLLARRRKRKQAG